MHSFSLLKIFIHTLWYFETQEAVLFFFFFYIIQLNRNIMHAVCIILDTFYQVSHIFHSKIGPSDLTLNWWNWLPQSKVDL